MIVWKVGEEEAYLHCGLLDIKCSLLSIVNSVTSSTSHRPWLSGANLNLLIACSHWRWDCYGSPSSSSDFQHGMRVSPSDTEASSDDGSSGASLCESLGSEIDEVRGGGAWVGFLASKKQNRFQKWDS